MLLLLFPPPLVAGLGWHTTLAQSLLQASGPKTITNQLFTDPTQQEGILLIDQVLSWCGANGMCIVLDLHAVPGAQGSDMTPPDALVQGGNDFWNSQINQDVTNRLGSTSSNRYKGDPRGHVRPHQRAQQHPEYQHAKR